jgi:hypothetical protein
MNRLVWKRRGPEMIAGIVAATLLGFAVALLAGASPSAAALVTSERSASSPATPTSARPPSRPPSATPALNTRSPTRTRQRGGAARAAARERQELPFPRVLCSHDAARIPLSGAGGVASGGKRLGRALGCESAESQNQVLEPPSVTTLRTARARSTAQATGRRSAAAWSRRRAEAARALPACMLLDIASLCVPPAR